MAKEYQRNYNLKEWDPENGGNLESFTLSLWGIQDINLNVQGNGWWAAITSLAGISDDDFEDQYLMKEFKRPEKLNFLTKKFPFPQLGWDWDAKGKVTSIKQQGACGSCWAFSAIAALESRYLIKKGLNATSNSIDLSEQQMLNCVSSPRKNTANNAYSTNSCRGGYSDQVFDYVRKYNVTTENIIPYEGWVRQCNQNPLVNGSPAQALKQNAPNPGFYGVKPSNATALKQAIQYTPAVFYIRAEPMFKVYSGGIYSTECSNSGVNHAMLAYGYSDGQGSDPFFQVKNSWGTGWGESGKARILMDTSNNGLNDGLCEMMKYAYYPNDAPQF